MKKPIKKTRAQLSYEYIVIIGAVMILLIPFFYQFTYSPLSRSSIMSAAVKNLDYGVQTVYNLGPGSKIFLPVQTAVIHEFNISNHTIKATLNPDGNSVEAYTGFNMVASSDVLDNLKKAGNVYVEITAVDCNGQICGIAFGKTLVCLGSSDSGVDDPIDINKCYLNDQAFWPQMEPSDHVVLWGNFDSNTLVYIDDGLINPSQMTLSPEGNRIEIMMSTLGKGVHNVYTVDSMTKGRSPTKNIKVEPEKGGGGDK